MGAIRLLLRSDANPLFRRTGRTPRKIEVPLDAAALRGHSEVVRGLIHQLGIEGCGGASGGIHALCLAAEKQHVNIMSILVDAGVVDTGVAV